MRVNDIFRSIQGEGARTGTLNVFVRFSGCNLTCSLQTHGFDCDTEFSSGRNLSEDEILEEVAELAGCCRSVILTGGEPLLQATPTLIQKLRQKYYVAVETNGTQPLPSHVDWVTVSPKTAEHTLRVTQADELRYVRSANQSIPKPAIRSANLFVSPAWGDEGPLPNALSNCLALVTENPAWRISLPIHKIMGVQ
jgi:7-carboxy-7-deazaguanine synthase